MLTVRNYQWNFWFLREERKYRERDSTLIPGFSVHMYARAHFVTISKKHFHTTQTHKKNVCDFE
jgi:hypothetical protein